MDHADIEERNVVERYLLGRLKAAEVEEFEEHYLDCPDCLERLELSRRLQQGLREVAAEESTKHLARNAILAWALRRGGRQLGMMAVAFAAVMLLPWLLLSGHRGKNGGTPASAAVTLAPSISTITYALSPERSTGLETPSTRVSLGTTPEWIALDLSLPPSAMEKRYRVRLREIQRQGPGESLWQSQSLEASTGGSITVHLHSSWLRESGYLLELQNLSAPGAPASTTHFSFRVRRPE